MNPIVILAIAIVSGFLIQELKDFISFGGVENKLAMIILRTVFLAFLIFLLGMVGLSSCSRALPDLDFKKPDPADDSSETNKTPKRIRRTSSKKQFHIERDSEVESSDFANNFNRN